MKQRFVVWLTAPRETLRLLLLSSRRRVLDDIMVLSHKHTKPKQPTDADIRFCEHHLAVAECGGRSAF